LIEIALCLAIIGFALVAIIAVLPRGLDVQKRNRQETIIGQDAEMWMNAIRNGAQGYDDLTNYVLSITNYWTIFNFGNTNPVSTNWDWYTANNSSFSGFSLVSGSNIIGILSTPKILIPPPFGRNGSFQSNYFVVYSRAFSGAEVEKAPETNATVLGDAFTYRMIVENFPYVPVDTNGYCMNCAATNGLTPDQMQARTNAAYSLWLMQTNLHDIRLSFRWPVLPNGTIPNYGLQMFRSMASGQMTVTNDPSSGQPLYFIQPAIYSQGQNTRKNALP
jgi:type II secretory pathway pseudopilin PulG